MRMRTSQSDITSSIHEKQFWTAESLAREEMSEKKQTVDLGLLEEDDEFEEFPAEGKWTETDCVLGEMRSFVNLRVNKRPQQDSDSASIAMLTDRTLFALFNKRLVCRPRKENVWIKYNLL